MFLGEYRHSLDEKGRVTLPAAFREQLREGAVMTRDLDGCIAVRTPADFEVRSAEMREQERTRGFEGREQARSFFSGADMKDIDRQGRMAIPQHLRAFADLERDVVIVGVFDRIEIWDLRRWLANEAARNALLASESN
jgi:MraZ protein